MPERKATFSVPDRTADVYFKDQLAGSLQETAGGGTRFVYRPDWQVSIACCLPVARREHEWQTGLHPFFEHLGTEGWLREQQARTAHVAQDDDFGLLLRYGADCIGAVSIRPPAGAEPPPRPDEAAVNPGRTVSGVQKKLFVVKDRQGRFAPAGAQGSAPYIAKFNSPGLPTIVRNELLSLRWIVAVLGKTEVTAFKAASVEVVNEGALIVTRFDRTAGDQKLRLEDFAQILCKPRGRDYSGKYDASYEKVAEAIRAHSARPAIDIARFFRRLIVIALVGNCDAHLKNFSLLEKPEGLRLSPVYDAVNTAVYEGYARELALSIAGRKVQLDALSAQTFRDFGRTIGLAPRAISQILADLGRKVRAPRATDILRPPQGEPPDGFTHRYAEIVSNACLRILAD